MQQAHQLIRHAGFSGLPNVILFNYIWLYFDKLVLLNPARRIAENVGSKQIKHKLQNFE